MATQTQVNLPIGWALLAGGRAPQPKGTIRQHGRTYRVELPDGTVFATTTLRAAKHLAGNFSDGAIRAQVDRGAIVPVPPRAVRSVEDQARWEERDRPSGYQQAQGGTAMLRRYVVDSFEIEADSPESARLTLQEFLRQRGERVRFVQPHGAIVRVGSGEAIEIGPAVVYSEQELTQLRQVLYGSGSGSSPT